MRMNNVEVHMKKINEWKIGDIVKYFNEKGFICEINENYYAVTWESQTECTYYRLNFDYGIINLSAIGRKAALASYSKVSRDSKGRFMKKEEYYGVSEAEFQTPIYKMYLLSLEKRIEALEKQMKQPEYKNCGGAGGC